MHPISSESSAGLGASQGTPLIMWRCDAEGEICIEVGGAWSLAAGVPMASELFSILEAHQRGCVVHIKVNGLLGWDSTLPLFVRRLATLCRKKGFVLNTAALPKSLSALLAQAETSDDARDVKVNKSTKGLREYAGRLAVDTIAEVRAQLSFLGLSAIALIAVLRGEVRHRTGTLLYLIQQCGPSAVPIVTLISLLVGMILAFIGAVQLRQFGAQLYIADLVGLGMAREMGAMMTAVIVAGRTGAAYAAELGSMRVNEEIDALRSLGIKPIELLVIPRIWALMLVMPLLCIYADCMGIVGGAVVTVGLFDISLLEYFNESRIWLHLSDFNVGIAKSVVFAALVAIAGCMRGMRCGTSSSDVGNAATSAVVTGIVWVVVADAILTLLITTLEL